MSTILDSPGFSSLEGKPYLSITTFRRDGTEASTPVWFVSDDLRRRILVATGATTWKVRRIRRDPHVRVAACTSRGKVTGGSIDGVARLVHEESLVRRLQREKYGWQPRGADRTPSVGDVVRGRGAALGIRNGTFVGNVAEVEVNRRTGSVRVTRYVVAHDCGLIINKLANPTTVTPGQRLTYTIQFANDGSSNSTGTVLSDTLPAGTSFVSATLNGNPVSLNFISSSRFTVTVNSTGALTGAAGASLTAGARVGADGLVGAARRRGRARVERVLAIDLSRGCRGSDRYRLDRVRRPPSG